MAAQLIPSAYSSLVVDAQGRPTPEWFNYWRGLGSPVASSLDAARGMINGILAVTQNGTAVTVAVKRVAGGDPSTSDPVYFVFNDGIGGYVIRTVTAALSFTFSSGSTAGFTNGTAPARIRWVAVDDAGTVRLGGINCYAAGSVFALDESASISSTAEGGAGAADSAGVFYTDAAVSAKYFRLLGHSEWDSGLAAAGTWNADPTRTVLHAPGTKLPGAIVQTKSGSRTTQDTWTAATYTTTNVSCAITPKSKHNIIIAEANGGIMIGTATDIGYAIIQRGGANVGVAQQVYGTANFQSGSVNLKGADAPASTGSLTYAVAVLISTAANSLFYPNCGLNSSGGSIFVSEIVA